MGRGVYLNYPPTKYESGHSHSLISSIATGKPLSPVPIHASMRITPHHVLVLALVYSSTPSVFATPAKIQPERSSFQGEPRVLGPIAQLNIVNKVIAPDGFPRSLSCVGLTCNFVLTSFRTVLAEGTFPGPLIAAEKVKSSWHRGLLVLTCLQGSDFKIKVVNHLHDTTMDTSTSLVRVSEVSPPFSSESPTALAWYLPEKV